MPNKLIFLIAASFFLVAAIHQPMIIYRPVITDAHLDALRKVESADGKFLKSPAGAEGPYQIMPFMQKAYGLKDPYDEKTSREVAKRILQDELEALGTLELAFAAYNAGRPTVTKALKKAGTVKWSALSRFLPEETKKYVPKISKYLNIPTDIKEPVLVPENKTLLSTILRFFRNLR
jgi:soluble lytic murein transglycosylase-like protein